MAVVLLSVLGSWAAEPDHIYKRIDIDINVTKDNKWKVKEDLTIKSQKRKNGIHLTLLKQFQLTTDVAGEGQPARMKNHLFTTSIYDCKATKHNYSIHNEETKTILWTGEKNTYLRGEQDFDFRYTIEYPLDRTPAYDWIYFPLIYGNYKERIKELNYKIHFAKPLPKEAQDSLKVFFGAYGADQELDRKFMKISIDSFTVSGVFRSLEPETSIVIYTRLPKDYFEVEKEVAEVVETAEKVKAVKKEEVVKKTKKAKPAVKRVKRTVNPADKSDTARHGLFISIILMTIFITYAIMQRQGRIQKLIDWYPPHGIGSAEVGKIINGRVSMTDIASLIPMIAYQGYISIRQGLQNDFILIKTNDLPADAPEYQKAMMHLLFHNGNIVQPNNIPGSQKLVNDVKRGVSLLYIGERKLVNISKMVLLVPAIAIASLVAFSTHSGVFSSDSMIVGLCLFVVPFLNFTILRFYATKLQMVNKFKRWRWFGLKLLAMLASMSFLCFMGSDIIASFMEFMAGSPDDDDYDIFIRIAEAFEAFDLQTGLITRDEYILLFLLAFAVQELCGNYITNTEYRNSTMGQLLGLKEFIETADRSRLESLTRQDPQYFYRVYPYAAALGLSSLWIDKFQSIGVRKPAWLETTDVTPIPLMQSLMAQVVSRLNSIAEKI